MEQGSDIGDLDRRSMTLSNDIDVVGFEGKAESGSDNGLQGEGEYI